MTGLTKPKAFFDWLRTNDMLGPTLSPDEVEGLNVITASAGLAGWPISWTAYALATAGMGLMMVAIWWLISDKIQEMLK